MRSQHRGWRPESGAPRCQAISATQGHCRRVATYETSGGVYCREHAEATGSPGRFLGATGTLAGVPAQDRFWSRVEKTPEGCWLWRGTVLSTGYGQFRADGRRQMAHRYSYELTRGPIADGLVLDHLCRTPLCVNPDHLEAVTDRVNVLRGVGLSARNAQKTHCPRGHVFDDANTGWIAGPSGRRRRYCRECDRERQRRRACLLEAMAAMDEPAAARRRVEQMALTDRLKRARRAVLA